MNRLFEMTYLLLNKKKLTAKELAFHFGVSQRTIYRDVDTLSLTGIPVFAEKGKGGGIGLLPDFVLNKSILSDREQQEILSALQGLSGLKIAESGEVLQKLSAVFNKSVTNWLEVDFSGWGSGNEDPFNGFKTAILERKITGFDYYGSDGKKAHRRIEPLQLCFKSRAWYVKGFCLTRQDMRFFKLSRVRKLKIQDEHFLERSLPHNQPDSEMVNGYKKNQITVKLKIAAEMAYRVYDDFSKETIVKQSDGGFAVTVRWPEDAWIYGFILSFGEYIEVLEPKRVKMTIKERAQKIVKKYS